MNMILHDNPTAHHRAGQHAGRSQVQGRRQPQDLRLRRRQSAVLRQALEHRPRSAATTRIERFKPFGVPPAKQGDYAYLLHIVRSLKSTGKGACILPHGVLFRGNAEADIRRAARPQGLHQGHHRPARQPLLRHRHPRLHRRARQGERPRPQGHLHDRRLQGLHEGRPQEPPARAGHPQDRGRLQQAGSTSRATRAWSASTRSRRTTSTSTCRATSTASEPEDLQDIDGHLQRRHPRPRHRCARALLGGLPDSSGTRCSSSCRPGYARSRRGEVGDQVRHLRAPRVRRLHRRHERPLRRLAGEERRDAQGPAGRLPSQGGHRRRSPRACSPTTPASRCSIAYDVYQHLMDYWAETMQDDCYLIAADGWKAETYRIIEKDKKGKEKDKGWTCDLIPKALIVARYFAKEQAAIDQLAAELEGVTARLTELEEEHGGEEGAFADLDKVNKANVAARLKEIKGDKDAKDEAAVLERLAEAQQRGGRSQEAPQGGRGRARRPSLREVSEAHRGRDQDAGGGRQVARRARCRHPRRDGPREPAAHSAREGAGRALREPRCRSSPISVAELEAKVNRHLGRMGFSWK